MCFNSELLTKKYLTLKHFKFILKRCTNFQYILDVGHCQDNWFFSYLGKTLSSFLVFSSVLIFQLLDTKNLNSNSLKNDFELIVLTQQYFTLTLQINSKKMLKLSIYFRCFQPLVMLHYSFSIWMQAYSYCQMYCLWKRRWERIGRTEDVREYGSMWWLFYGIIIGGLLYYICIFGVFIRWKK